MRTGLASQLAALAGLFVLWEVGVRAFGVSPGTMPTASAVFLDIAGPHPMQASPHELLKALEA